MYKPSNSRFCLKHWLLDFRYYCIENATKTMELDPNRLTADQLLFFSFSLHFYFHVKCGRLS